MRKRGVVSGTVCVRAVLVALSVGASACATPQGDTERPWEGTPVMEADYEAMLRPEEPLGSAGLFVGKDRKLYYVAHLREEPGRGFLDAYQKQIQSRGFLIFASGDSPHSILPRVTGYRFVVFKKGPVRPFTLFYRWFYDSPAGKDLPPPRSYPFPVQLHGRTLVVTLGTEALEPWEKSVVVPEEDVVDVKELPFPRFPGAVLTRVSRHEGPYGLRRGDVLRSYVVRGASIEDILTHYRGVLQQHGIPIGPVHGATAEYSWFSRDNPVQGLYQASVEPALLMVVRTELSTQTLGKWAPSLLEDLPADVVAFTVNVGFVRSEVAAEYWTAEEQAARAALLAQEQQKEK
jgi:hypothetical protein